MGRKLSLAVWKNKGATAQCLESLTALKDKMNAEFAKITLEQLLSHVSSLVDEPGLIDHRSYESLVAAGGQHGRKCVTG